MAKKDLKPRYEVTCKSSRGSLPHEVRDAETQADATIVGESLATRYPGSIIEWRLRKGFTHGKPMRWERTGKCQYKVVRRFDQLASGKKTPRKQKSTLFNES